MKKNNIIKLSLAAILSLQIGALAENNTNKLNSLDVVADDSYTVETMNTSTGLNLSLKDTPQIISVITAKQLEDKGILTYDDLINNIAGVTNTTFDDRQNAVARGFDLDYYKVDGVPVKSFFSSRTLDMSLYERVEIVKGANGLTTGAGGLGISINLIRKKANSKELKGTVDLAVDSHGSKTLTADVATSLNEAGTVRGRFIVKSEQGESYLDELERDKNIVMGIIDVDISENTKISTSISYEKVKSNNVKWGSIPLYNTDGTKRDDDVSTNITDDCTYTNTEAVSLSSNLEHYMGETLLKASYNYENAKTEAAWFYYGDFYSDYRTYLEDKENTRHSFDLNINIPTEVDGIQSELLLGITHNVDELTKMDSAVTFGVAVTGTYPNFSTPEPDSSGLASEGTSKTKQTSIYLANNLDITDKLKFIAGARITKYTYAKSTTPEYDQDFTETTPYIGVVYDINNEHSVYASYTSIFSPQAFRDSTGAYLDPITGNSIETGIKGEYFNNKLTTSFGLFKIKQDNASEIDPTYATLANGDFIYNSIDGVESKGMEIEINGKINDATTLTFNATKFDAEKENGDKFNTIAARTTANLFAKYNYKDFTFGGGLKYSSSYYLESTAFKTIRQKAFTLVNAMMNYKVSKNINATLNVSNLFDKKYYAGMAGDATISYGAPRTFTAKLTYSF